MLGSQRSDCHDKTNVGFVDSNEGVGRKGRMLCTTNRYRAEILDGHRDRQIRKKPTSLQTYLPTFLHTHTTTSLQPYPTTPTLPYTYILPTHVQWKLKIKNDCVWKRSPLETGGVYCSPRKLATLGLPKHQRSRVCESLGNCHSHPQASPLSQSIFFVTRILSQLSCILS